MATAAKGSWTNGVDWHPNLHADQNCLKGRTRTVVALVFMYLMICGVISGAFGVVVVRSTSKYKDATLLPKMEGPDAWSLMYPSILDKLHNLYNDGYKQLL